MSSLYLEPGTYQGSEGDGGDFDVKLSLLCFAQPQLGVKWPQAQSLGEETLRQKDTLAHSKVGKPV